jgi:hypothetical protein
VVVAVVVQNDDGDEVVAVHGTAGVGGLAEIEKKMAVREEEEVVV